MHGGFISSLKTFRYPNHRKTCMVVLFLVSELSATLIIQKSQELVFRHNSKRQPTFLPRSRIGRLKEKQT